MSKITLDNLSEKLKEYIDSTGMTEDQVIDIVKNNLSGDLSGLNTNNKSSLVAAINELFQNANNGKELIATAIGEPLISTDTFSAMSTGINSLLSTFKTNMMNNGVVVESNDKFKTLIDKIATLADSEGKGIQMTNGTFSYNHPIKNTYGELETTTVNTGLNFNPTLILVNCTITTDSYPYTILRNGYINNLETFTYKTDTPDRPTLDIYIDNITKESFNLNVSTTVYTGVQCTKWVAIGVGEEDTTLRDSLASILENKGIGVTPEDDLDSLITKVDSIKVSKASDTLLGLMDLNSAIYVSSNLPYKLENYTYTVNGDYLYLAGTVGDTSSLYRCKISDICAESGGFNKFEKISSSFMTYYADICSLDHYIIGYQYTKCYKYDIDLGTVTTSTTTSESYGATALIPYNNNVVFRCGGRLNSDTNDVTIIRKYDITTDTWTLVKLGVRTYGYYDTDSVTYFSQRIFDKTTETYTTVNYSLGRSCFISHPKDKNLTIGFYDNTLYTFNPSNGEMTNLNKNRMDYAYNRHLAKPFYKDGILIVFGAYGYRTSGEDYNQDFVFYIEDII